MYDPAYFPRIYPGLKRLATNLSGMNLLWLGMILILLSVESHSQTNKKYYFEQLNSLDGLSSNIVEDVFQDSDGFLWVCTKDGLNRYDGYSFKTFKPSLKQQNTFSSNKFTCIAEDQKGRLWIGTKNNGINIYNKSTGKVRHISDDTTDPRLPSGNIISIHIDHDGNKWIGTSNYGILRLDSANRLTVYRTKRKHLSSVQNIREIYEDRDGRIWIGSWNEGMFYYDKNKDDFIRVNLPWPAGADIRGAVSMKQDRRGRYWFGSWGSGLFRMDSLGLEPEQIKHYSFEKRFSSKRPKSSEIGNLIYSIEEDKNGDIWLGTNNGIVIMDQHTAQTKWKIRASQENHYAPDNSQIYNLFCDREGIMWVGTRGSGLNKVNLDRKKFHLHEVPFEQSKMARESSVFSFCELDRDDLLIGVKSEGFFKHNKSTNEITSYRNLKAFQDLPWLNLVYDFHKDSRGRIWLGTRYHGLYRVDRDKGEYVHLNERYEGLNCRAVYCFMEDVDENIWVGTDNGLFILKSTGNGKKEYELYHSVHSQMDSTTLSGNQVTALFQDSRGDVWIGTMNQGLNRYSDNFVKQEMTYRRYQPHGRNLSGLRSRIINDIYEDSRDNLWIGTNGGGLVCYMPDQDRFKNYLREEGLVADNVLSILEARDSSLWLGTNKGLVNFSYHDTEQYRFTKYTVKDGLQGRIFIRGAKLASSYEGSFYFGGYNGFNSFQPCSVKHNTVKPEVAITALKFNGENQPFDADVQKNIVVPSSVKTISIEFSALSFKHPEQNQYAYMLEGYNDQWQYNEAADRKAVFTNLPRGDYALKVKASNSNGVWCHKPITLSFDVQPSPYASNVALIIYGLIIFGIFYAIFRTVIYRTKMKQELKFEEELRAKKEKQHQSKLRLLTNISHEFLTPLSIISSVLDNAAPRRSLNGQSEILIRRNVNVLKDLVNQFLLVRKSEAGTLYLHVGEHDLRDHLDKIYKSFHPVARRKNLQYQMFVCEQSLQGYYDQDKLDKILHNLLSNAFKFTDRGRVEIHCQDYYKTDGFRYAQIKVSDTGRGIPEDQFQRIFKRFKRVEPNNTTGIGIGLELTKSLVELHKGTIQLESKLNEGTSFIFEIPVDPSAYSEQEKNTTDNQEEAIIIDGQYDALGPDEPLSLYEEQQPDQRKEDDKSIILVAGNKVEGTLAAVLALTKFHNKLLEDYNTEDTWAKVIQGLDMSGDGKIDFIKILE